MVLLQYFRVNEHAKRPEKANALDACYDIFACLAGVKSLKTSYSISKVTESPMMAGLTIVKHSEMKDLAPILNGEDNPFVMLPAFSSTIIPTGVVYGIPAGYRMDVRARSGRAAKYRQYLTNGIGTIDAGYDDQLYVMITNASAESFKLSHHDKIAQMHLEAVVPIELSCVASRSCVQMVDSNRDGGLGSTGDK